MRKILLSLAVVALAVPVFADHFNKVVKVGDKAPDFSGIPAVSPSGEQSSLTLSDLKEDVVVLVFLANHCPVVQACDDRIIDFANDYKDKPVKLVAVSVNDIDQDRLPGIKQHMKDKKLNYTYGYDESQAIGHAYGATPRRTSSSSTRSGRSATSAPWTTTPCTRRRSPSIICVTRLTPCSPARHPRSRKLAAKGCSVKYKSSK